MREAQSDLILDLVQSAAQVESEIETHTEEVAAGLDEDFAPLFVTWEDGQEKPDFRATLRAMKDKLGDSREKLSLAEERHVDLIREAVGLRGEREELTGSLYEDFSSMRRTVEELHRGKGKGNPSVFVVAGIQGPTAQKPTRLLRQVDLATQHLEKPGLEFPVSRFSGTRLEPKKLARVLAPRAERLRGVQADLRRVGSELNASRKEKNRALEAHRETLSWVAQGAESFFRLAGEHELADRLHAAARRAVRRPSASGGQQGDDAAASPAESAQADNNAEATAGDAGSSDTPTGESQPATSPPVAEASESAPSPPPNDG